MKALLEKLLTINTPDEDTRRRGRNIIYIILGLFIIIIFGVVIWLVLAPFELGQSLYLFLPMVVYIFMIVIIRRGYVTTAALIIFFMLLSLITVGVIENTAKPWGMFLFMLPLVFASVTLRPLYLWPIFLLISIGIGIATWVVNSNSQYIPLIINDMLFVIMLFGIFTLMLFLSSQGLERSLQQENVLRNNAEIASQKLLEVNDNLEQLVATRTADLQKALVDVQDRESHLTRTLEELSSSQDTIRDLSAPLIPILPGVLVSPMIGSFTEQRGDDFMQNILLQVRKNNIRVLILDVTGTPLIDTYVANILLHISQAVKLLGAKTILVGIRPEVAQTLVALNIDFVAFEVFANLQEAVLALIRQDRGIIKQNRQIHEFA